MRTYLNYLIHKKWLQTLVMAIIPTLIMVFILSSTNFRRYTSGGFSDPDELLISIIFMMIVMIVIVIFRFSSLRNPKEVDLYYALPISRQKLFLTHFIYGLFQILFVWTILYFSSFITLILITQGGYQEGWLLLIYFVVLFYLVVLYSVYTFIFLKANTIFDGIAFIILFQILFLFVSLLFTGRLFLYGPIFNEPFFLNPYFSVSGLSIFLGQLSNGIETHQHSSFMFSLPYIIVNSVIYLSLAAFLSYYQYHHVDEIKTENIGQLSSSKLGYRFYIPAILITSIPNIFFLGTGITFVLVIILISAGFIGSFIYKRGLKITWVDAGYVLIPTLIGMILGILMNGYH